ncbi:hypothetical protein BU16DRAFT_524862 [Lophium mytilinum]|uniref:F-box domain-containing protein n=1 Tax=Lophium mytilinum TaxID=390894 RepID=A0A6A6R282_9PEZI|nr:hypothetical protein BU16DRAFT_524862 [Lophium mytilinum]
MALATMPDDILIEILSCCHSENRILKNLALVSHRLSLLVPTFLFRHISITLPDTPYQLERCLRENPDLARHIRSLTVVSLDEQLRFWRLLPTNLSRFRNLRTVELNGGWRKPGHQHSAADLSNRQISELEREFLSAFNDELIENLRHSSVNNIRFNRFSSNRAVINVTSTIIVRLLQIEGLRNLSLTGLSELGDIDVSMLSTNLVSHTENLQLGSGYWSIDPMHMKSIMAYAPSLKSLTSFLPGLSELTFRLPHHFITNMLQPFDGGALSSVLAPLKVSLEVLDLSGVIQHWPGRQPGPFDLSDFEKLRRIVAPSICFFQLGPPQIDRYELHNQLPASLEELSITFSSETSIFTNDLSADPSHTITVPQSLDWLMQFAMKVLDHLPNLRSVQLRETRRFKRTRRQTKVEVVPWIAPAKVQEAFDGAKVKLEVLVRQNMA